eukprot:10970350-Alexandrium_andersonii.AAC.1
MAQQHAGPRIGDGLPVQRGVAPGALERLQADVEMHLQASWPKTPRGAGASPQGDRFEHWAAL